MMTMTMIMIIVQEGGKMVTTPLHLALQDLRLHLVAGKNFFLHINVCLRILFKYQTQLLVAPWYSSPLSSLYLSLYTMAYVVSSLSLSPGILPSCHLYTAHQELPGLLLSSDPLPLRSDIFFLRLNLYPSKEASKIKHRKNCESCPTQVTWKVKFTCQICLSCL